MRVLVTGSNGQVGHFLSNQLEGTVELLAVDKEGLDITDRDAVFALVSAFKPDYIINAAAYTAVDKAEEEVELAYAVNRNGSKFLAEAAKMIGSTILHISTDYVFSGNKHGVYSEGDKTGPTGVYGKSKLAGEVALIDENERYIVLRTAWVFGEHDNNFVKTMLRLGKDRDALSIVGDQYGGPTYAGDIAQALITIMNKLSEKGNGSLYGIYHFSGAPHVNWYEFANTIFYQAEALHLLKAPTLSSITTDMYPTAAVRPKNSKMSGDKIEHIFGTEPSNWQAALENLKGYMDLI